MIPRFFILQELLPKDDFNTLYPIYGQRCWQMFDDRQLETNDNLRKIYGKMVANTWLWGGSNQYRGWRPGDCPVGARISQYKGGRATDLIPIEASVNEIRRDILADVHPYAFRHITAIELDVPWLHTDCRNHDKQRLGILEIKP